MQSETITLENGLQFLKILNVHQPYDRGIAHPDIYPKEKKKRKLISKLRSFTKLLMTSLFIIAPDRKQPKFSSVGEWLSVVHLQHVLWTDYLNPHQVHMLKP